jgi:hypothetical protein
MILLASSLDKNIKCQKIFIFKGITATNWSQVHTHIILMVVLGVSGMSNASATICLEKKDDGSRVNLEPGDTLVIALDANPTTGYGWNVVREMGSSLRLTLVVN